MQQRIWRLTSQSCNKDSTRAIFACIQNWLLATTRFYSNWKSSRRELSKSVGIGSKKKKSTSYPSNIGLSAIISSPLKLNQQHVLTATPYLISCCMLATYELCSNFLQKSSIQIIMPFRIPHKYHFHQKNLIATIFYVEQIISFFRFKTTLLCFAQIENL